MAELRPLLDLQNTRSCDFSIGGLYMWREYFKQRYTLYNGMLIVSVDYPDSGRCYSFPVGNGDLEEALLAIKQDAKEKGVPLKFCCIPEELLPELTGVLGQPSAVTEFRNWADYLYPYENFLGYHGKKLVTPRNHCNRFRREFPDYEYTPMTAAQIPAAKAFLLENESVFKKDLPIVHEDFKRTLEVLDHFELFGFTGGLLSVGGKTIGITMGESIGDTLFVHVEKALTEYSGAYPMLASLYAAQNANDALRFINREDDSGDSGLRKSKLEYRPCRLISKFVAEF